MSKAPRVIGTIARRTVSDGVDFARLVIVLACAGALILAGKGFPF